MSDEEHEEFYDDGEEYEEEMDPENMDEEELAAYYAHLQAQEELGMEEEES